MSAPEMVKVIHFPMDEEPRVLTIKATLGEMRRLVGGGYVGRCKVGEFDVWCDDDGIPNGLPLNRVVGQYEIHGPFFVCRRKMTSPLDGEVIASVTDTDVRDWWGVNFLGRLTPGDLF